MLSVEDKKKHAEYFMELEEKVKTTRRTERSKERRAECILAPRTKKEEQRTKK